MAPSRNRRRTLTGLPSVGMLILLAAGSVAAGDEPRAVIQGSWIATFGSRQYRGEWSAQALANNPNAAVGSWTLFGDGNKIVLQGTWSPRRRQREGPAPGPGRPRAARRGRAPGRPLGG